MCKAVIFSIFRVVMLSPQILGHYEKIHFLILILDSIKKQRLSDWLKVRSKYILSTRNSLCIYKNRLKVNEGKIRNIQF